MKDDSMADDSVSFDPLTWRDPASAVPLPEKGQDRSVATATIVDRRLLLAFCGSVLLLGIAAFGAWRARPAMLAARPAPAASSSTPMLYHMLTLPDANGLAEALLSARILPEDVRATNRLARRFIGGRRGILHVKFMVVPRTGSFRLQRLEATFDDGTGATVFRSRSGFAGSAVSAPLHDRLELNRVRPVV